MGVYTTEIASDKIPSDNPIHQRLLQAYYLARPYVHGNLLEVGCGEGRGIHVLKDSFSQYTGLDKIQEVIDVLSKEFPEYQFIQSTIPPIQGLDDNSYDSIVTFQVIEHIRPDKEFLRELYRLLKPGGTALVTTPNIRKTLTRNPWHIREYTPEQLGNLALEVFDEVQVKGIAGNDKVMTYYEMNKKAVRKITRFDILNLQYRLPAALLRIPYDLLNRLNRNNLRETDDSLVKSIGHDDYVLTDDPTEALDLFCILRKKR